MEFTEQEKQTILACINIAIRNAPNAIQAAGELLPLANKVANSKVEKEPKKAAQ